MLFMTERGDCYVNQPTRGDLKHKPAGNRSVPMTRFRKQMILERAEAVPEYESSVADAMSNLADATRTLAGAVCTAAASAHTKTPGEQRDMAAVFFDDATHRFGDVLRRMDKNQRAKLDAFIEGLCKGKR